MRFQVSAIFAVHSPMGLVFGSTLWVNYEQICFEVDAELPKRQALDWRMELTGWTDTVMGTLKVVEIERNPRNDLPVYIANIIDIGEKDIELYETWLEDRSGTSSGRKKNTDSVTVSSVGRRKAAKGAINSVSIPPSTGSEVQDQGSASERYGLSGRSSRRRSGAGRQAIRDALKASLETGAQGADAPAWAQERRGRKLDWLEDTTSGEIPPWLQEGGLQEGGVSPTSPGPPKAPPTKPSQAPADLGPPPEYDLPPLDHPDSEAMTPAPPAAKPPAGKRKKAPYALNATTGPAYGPQDDWKGRDNTGVAKPPPRDEYEDPTLGEDELAALKPLLGTRNLEKIDKESSRARSQDSRAPTPRPASRPASPPASYRGLEAGNGEVTPPRKAFEGLRPPGKSEGPTSRQAEHPDAAKPSHKEPAQEKQARPTKRREGSGKSITVLPRSRPPQITVHYRDRETFMQDYEEHLRGEGLFLSLDVLDKQGMRAFVRIVLPSGRDLRCRAEVVSVMDEGAGLALLLRPEDKALVKKEVG